MNTFKHVKKLGLVLGAALLCLAANLQADDLLKKTVEISNIDRLEVAGPGLLTLSQGDTESLEIVASEKMMERIEVDARGSTLRLRLKDGSNWGFFKIDSKIHYQLTLKSLNKISTAGSIDLELATDLNLDDFKLERAGSGDSAFLNINAQEMEVSNAGSGDFNAKIISAKNLELSTAGSGDVRVTEIRVNEKVEFDTAGSGDIDIDQLTANELEVNMAGSGDTSIGQGSVQRQSVDIGGSGNYSAAKLKSASAELDLSGSADAVVWVTDELVVDASGASDVKYYGQPKVEADTSGASSVKSQGMKP
ncbi:DUF2807 domain-containing protein [Simiduia curdlanivorans]|uniref:GIN domain-containing protein n=1 Tax=Simiduia curdlanivorans TaxID=1492769 RepID=A0ABV8V4X7_9GAMM|nr:DUF2807 domain-containing protein [Simiduia curdlanivorans]MDN3640555.1 DUF2807 domain-containing protein [Simiduia curdlanivorans]